MSLKLKALGLGLLAAMAMSAVAVMNAGAETGGHFTSSASHTVLNGQESGEHRVKFASDGGTPIECTSATYAGTISGTSATSVDIMPTYSQCRTESDEAGTHKLVVNMEGCGYKFTVSKTPTGHNTVHLTCPTGASARITHPNCVMRMPAQTPTGGVAYTGVTEKVKVGGNEVSYNAITADVTVTGITAHYESGICVFLGTKHTATMTGSVTLRGVTEAGNPVDIGATG